MFDGCGNINAVTCLATTITGSNCTTDWLNGVDNSGTFTKAEGASCWSSGSNGIPYGWTVNEYQPEYRYGSYCHHVLQGNQTRPAGANSVWP